MTTLQNSAVAGSGIHQAIGFGQSGRDGLLHEHVNAAFQQGVADFAVTNGGDGDDGGVDVADNICQAGGGNCVRTRRLLRR